MDLLLLIDLFNCDHSTLRFETIIRRPVLLFASDQVARNCSSPNLIPARFGRDFKTGTGIFERDTPSWTYFIITWKLIKHLIFIAFV